MPIKRLIGSDCEPVKFRATRSRRPSTHTHTSRKKKSLFSPSSRWFSGLSSVVIAHIAAVHAFAPGRLEVGLPSHGALSLHFCTHKHAHTSVKSRQNICSVQIVTDMLWLTGDGASGFRKRKEGRAISVISFISVVTSTSNDVWFTKIGQISYPLSQLSRNFHLIIIFIW
jgi:hypothetical protein